MVNTRGERWSVEEEEGKGGINGGGRRLGLGTEHITQMTNYRTLHLKPL